ncbi:MAG: lgt 1 [Mucilaginibacter sp.]|uniref:prolipoprotein diacylglyceryl transferase n=1 Tax=Mucilaginibacter sp. TaxID=1882438 RepID=UPI00262C1ADE|nr:prolipoprotein diacylglyceryl transferase family protein [Mucilaginibacter sp.]MDB5002508.1 lgt 1 [Mucilaginibacter sp.]
MFPTLTDLIEYLFHVHILVPIQTFGFFIALCFFFAYFVFVAELKRKEQEGLISAFTEKDVVGAPASYLEIALNGLAGFLFGFKAVGAVINFATFTVNPIAFIFSLQGNLVAGLLVGIGFTLWIYTDRKKEQLPQPIVVERVIHPYQTMAYLGFILGFWGVIGSKLFSIIEDFHIFLLHPVDVIFSTNGFTYYGGLIFGSIAWLYINHKRGMKLIHLADIGSPGTMLAYGIGRVGCHLSGDGDWGIVNRHVKPGWLQWLPDWMWANKFPHNAINAGAHINGCFGQHCNILRAGVYPTSFYEATICILLFVFMWLIRRHIHTPGLMFYLFLILNGTERFLIELIRVTEKYHWMGLTFTQAELICLIIITGGITGIVYLILTRNKPIRTDLI